MRTRETLAVTAAIVLGLTSLALWTLARTSDGRRRRAPEDMDALELRIGSMEEKLEELRGDLEKLRAADAYDETTSRRPVEVPEREELPTQIAQLEADLATLEAEWRAWAMNLGPTGASGGGAVADEDDLELAGTRLARDALLTYQSALGDRDLPQVTRLEVLALLRRFPRSMNALDPVMGDIVELLSGSLEGRGAENVIDAVSGINDDRLVDPLLQILSASSDHGVRREAVRALKVFIELPGVLAALEAVSREENEAGRQAKAVLRFHSFR